MPVTRSAQVAGTFYPNDQASLKALVNRYLEEAKKSKQVTTIPKAIISPHAGLTCSGIIAAKGYSCLAAKKKAIKHVILFGPSHRYPADGMAVTKANYYSTPLGTIPLDCEKTEQMLAKFSQVKVSEQAFDMPENSLETQMPFLQETLKDFSMLPVLIGETTPESVACVMESFWGGDDTIIVVSSDLSHYHDYETAKAIDQKTIKSILQAQPYKIEYEQACGLTGIQALLLVAIKKKLKIELVDYCNSGDTIGSRDQVVGYAAFHLY